MDTSGLMIHRHKVWGGVRDYLLFSVIEIHGKSGANELLNTHTHATHVASGVEVEVINVLSRWKSIWFCFVKVWLAFPTLYIRINRFEITPKPPTTPQIILLKEWLYLYHHLAHFEAYMTFENDRKYDKWYKITRKMFAKFRLSAMDLNTSI